MAQIWDMAWILENSSREGWNLILRVFMLLTSFKLTRILENSSREGWNPCPLWSQSYNCIAWNLREFLKRGLKPGFGTPNPARSSINLGILENSSREGWNSLREVLGPRSYIVMNLREFLKRGLKQTNRSLFRIHRVLNLREFLKRGLKLYIVWHKYESTGYVNLREFLKRGLKLTSRDKTVISLR